LGKQDSNPNDPDGEKVFLGHFLHSLIGPDYSRYSFFIHSKQRVLSSFAYP